MLLTVALVLVLLWLLGFTVFPVAGGLVHVLLVIALVAIVWHFVGGRRVRL